MISPVFGRAAGFTPFSNLTTSLRVETSNAAILSTNIIGDPVHVRLGAEISDFAVSWALGSALCAHQLGELGICSVPVAHSLVSVHL